VIGFLSDGSPLQALLNELGPDAAERVGNALTQGVITGADVRTISRNVRRAFGGNLARALIISRTVVLQAYREASMQQYRANAEVVGSWTWLSTRGPRTCGFCWAMHGSIHPLSTRMASHPACRCTMLPNLRHAPDTTPIERGPAVFADEDATLQRAVLGPAKYAAYTSGALALEQLPGFRIDPRWGRVGFERSLRAILGDEAKRYYGHAA
jgi:SPP1 gp7 family putative phage head morphogenesis protein